MATPCDCAGCPNGAPSQYSVTFSGTTNSSCTTCGDFNGTYTLSQISACAWSFTFAAKKCGWQKVQLAIQSNGSGGYDMVVSLVASPAPDAVPTWKHTSISDCFGTFS